MAESISDAQRLCALDEQQARIVYLIRHKYTNEEIGQAIRVDKRRVDKRTVSDYMAPIYDTLDIHLDNPNAKREEITKRYGDLIDQYIPDEAALEYWVPIPLPPEPQQEDMAQPQEKMTPSDIGEPITDIGEKQTDASQSEKVLNDVDQISRRQVIEDRPPPPRFPRWIIAVATVFVLCLVCTTTILFGVGFIRPLVEDIIVQFQATQPPTNLEESPTTQGPTISVQPQLTNTLISGVTLTSLPSSTNIPASPTSTSSPTVTPTITTPTPTITPLPSPRIFIDGVEPKLFNKIYGDVLVVNNALTATENSLLMVGDETWKDYSIEFSFFSRYYEFAGRGIGGYIGVRVKDEDNQLVFRMSQYDFDWQKKENGKLTGIPGTRYRNVSFGKRFLRIYVQKDKITTYVGEKKIADFSIEDYNEGGVAIFLIGKSSISDLKIVEIP